MIFLFIFVIIPKFFLPLLKNKTRGNMKKKEQTYSGAIAEIEAIIKKIENSDLNLDEVGNDVERAMELIRFCKSKLHATEDNINKMLESLK